MRRLILAALLIAVLPASAADYTMPGSRAQSRADSCDKRLGTITCSTGGTSLTVSPGSITANAATVNLGSTALTVNTLELGNTTDTTLSRSGAGALAVEGVNVVLTSRTLTGGTGIAAIGDLSTDRTITLDLTELSTATFGAGAFTALTFDAGATDPTFTFGSNSTTVTNSATFSLGTATTFTTGTIELGNASDTTLSRSAGGTLAVEGVDLVKVTRTLTGGTGIAAIGDLSTDRTISTANTEINDTTWGDNSDATMVWTFDHSGATNTLLEFSNGALAVEGITTLRQADAANAGGMLRLAEDPGTGTDYIAFQAPASITTTFTCTLENDSNPIPDSCVGDGTDAGAGGGVTASGTPVDNQVAVWTSASAIEGDTAFTFDTTTDALSVGTGGIFTVGTIELGAASDTTLSRPGAGRLAVEGVDVVTTAGHGITKSNQTVNAAPWVVYPVYAALGGL